MKLLGEAAPGFLDYARRRFHGVPSGIPIVDSSLQGMGGFVIIKGEPKSCKSTFLGQILVHNALKGNPVLWYDRENGINRTTQRVLCCITGRSWNSLNTMKDQRLIKYQERLASYPIYYSNRMVGVSQIAEEVEILIGQFPDKILLLAVDSLQAMMEDSPDPRHSIDRLLIALDDLKLKYQDKLVILVTSEKTQSTYGYAGKVGAKESGRIEYKGEKLIDMQECPDTGNIIMQTTSERDGPNKMQIRLEKELEDPQDPRSFIYRLKEQEIL